MTASLPDKTPAALGYRMPAEWEPHAATWLAWPHNRDSWPGRFDPIPQVWARLVETLAGHEAVHILAGGPQVMQQAETMVGHLPHVVIHDVPTNDAWTRDHGPTFLGSTSGQPPALVDWRYNAWGGKYPPFDLDDRVPEQVSRLTGRRRFAADVVLEGGAIDCDGQGTLIASSTCLLNRNRNPGLSRGDLEQRLAHFLAAERVIWVEGALAGDDTDGHVDQLARFVAPGVVVVAAEENEGDENYPTLRAIWQTLQHARDAAGRRLELIRLPMPAPVFHQQHRLPASYANFYVANGVVIVPAFGVRGDEQAADVLAQCFPDRRICLLPAADLAWGLGAYHCITQQEPAT